ncbi:2-oxo acid dehydrogenase subunit E2 [Microbacterium sp. CFH 90308]|uniref:Dihydrolipoamide acetyltransferase component of pyruvate dehydrogenase complex n=1 Tax=Microbacterium salsuginis TaxID=2722803 RepID=A0ABX1K928_9MICO|nr:dihydrolipoamide acetyltransferase family protein [Microbacterium sp. CFH 90308]NLP82635.1 2-oxo acid dehydrogenase subunit E2 [Microbacterium sp. CFH 90308]
MAAVVRMPALAAGAAEAAIQSWLVGVGEPVAQGQAIVEIETEKAVVEYEAEQDGVLAGILVPDGDSAAVGSPIAVLAEAGESSEQALAAAAAEGARPAAVTAAAPGAVEPTSTEPTTPAPASPELASPELASPVPATPAPASPTESSEDGLLPAPAPVDAGEPSAGDTARAPSARRLFASPLVRRLARERGIDLDTIRGSGPQGRIVRRDLDDLARPSAEHVAAPISGGVPVAAEGAPASVPSSPAPEPPAHEDVPHTGMRRAIARRLTESVTTVPHFFVVADCRVDELLSLRARINEQLELKVSVNDFVLKAVAWAMRDVPEANAIWTDAATRRFTGVDIAIAVAVPAGLVTPVLRGVERMTLGELSGASRELAQRAREGRIKQHELEGGSFSVSNLGMYGTKEFSAIINPPHSGILAVGAASPRPVVGADGELTVANVMTVTLSADHRVLDGALAAQWLAAFVRRIENPLSLLV